MAWQQSGRRLVEGRGQFRDRRGKNSLARRRETRLGHSDHVSECQQQPLTKTRRKIIEQTRAVNTPPRRERTVYVDWTWAGEQANRRLSTYLREGIKAFDRRNLIQLIEEGWLVIVVVGRRGACLMVEMGLEHIDEVPVASGVGGEMQCKLTKCTIHNKEVVVTRPTTWHA